MIERSSPERKATKIGSEMSSGRSRIESGMRLRKMLKSSRSTIPIFSTSCERSSVRRGTEMVSPADGWEDVEGGYEKSRTGVYVEPVATDSGGGMLFVETVSAEKADSYEISIVEEMRTASERHRTLVRVKEARKAWELAHILTKYIDYTGDPMIARSNLMEDPQTDKKGGFPDMSEMGAEEAFREALGYYEYEADEFL